MKHSDYYNMRLPQRGANESEENDSADIEDLNYNFKILDEELNRQRITDELLETQKATKKSLQDHISFHILDHPDASVTDEKIGKRTIGNVSDFLQGLLTLIGNMLKSITGENTWNTSPKTTLLDTKKHIDENIRHITANERSKWNNTYIKSEIDTFVSSKLSVTGGVLTGALTLHATPNDNMHAATKKYVDDKILLNSNGDMFRSIYDTNNSGVVDNSEKVNGFTVSVSVPANAKFTDTTYNIATPTVNGLMSAVDKTKLDNQVGDMKKSVYDTNNSGIVDYADSIDGGTY